MGNPMYLDDDPERNRGSVVRSETKGKFEIDDAFNTCNDKNDFYSSEQGQYSALCYIMFCTTTTFMGNRQIGA